VLDDLLLQNIRRRQIVQLVQAVVLQPEDVQTGLVARHQCPRSVNNGSARGDALVAVFRVVAGDEVVQVVQLQRAASSA
jgi:uncharacterized sporulation protein YeaH/YhbH (DUF444 family)